jgi:hypothetical protein
MPSPSTSYAMNAADQTKCNEATPHCAGCAKRSIPCHYPVTGRSPRDAPTLRPDWGQHPLAIPPSYPGSISPRDHGLVSSGPSVPSQALSGPGGPRNLSVGPSAVGQFGMDDMALWHQFITATAATISSHWGKELPLLAFNCDYLLHGILATAALHLAYLNPDQRDRYNYQSAHHQDLALGPFRQAMSEITPENCNQVFAFSILLMVSNYASFWCVDYLRPLTPVTGYTGLSNWIVCLRGCSSIFQQARSHIMSGPLGFLAAQEDWATTLATPPTEAPQTKDEQSLQYLADHLFNLPYIKSSTTVEALDAYTDAIFRLRKLLSASSQTTDIISIRSMSSAWPSTISDTFIWLLNERRPPALLIMGHYCLLLKRSEAYWYMEHRANDIFEAVHRTLPEEWFPYLEHPLQVFKG